MSNSTDVYNDQMIVMDDDFYVKVSNDDTKAYADDGSIDPAAHDRARQLLQGDAIERVSRNLARAIVARHDLDPAREPELRDRIEAVAGRPAAVDDLASSLGIAA